MAQQCKKPNGLIELESQFLSVLAQETRLKILCLLRDKPKCLCELSPIMEEDASTISRHLNILKSKGILASEKKGVRIAYHIRDERVCRILELVDQIILSKFKETAKVMKGV